MIVSIAAAALALQFSMTSVGDIEHWHHHQDVRGTTRSPAMGEG
ncbi:hypothetical protein [Bradyrhizobium lablabi]|nr:hypothetical protein [Bradyrhizobium lablabi]